jgi:hypothetical protein
MQGDRDQGQDQQHEKPARQELAPIGRITTHRQRSRGTLYSGSIAAGTNVSTGALAALIQHGSPSSLTMKKYEYLISRRRQHVAHYAGHPPDDALMPGRLAEDFVMPEDAATERYLRHVLNATLRLL